LQIATLIHQTFAQDFAPPTVHRPLATSLSNQVVLAAKLPLLQRLTRGPSSHQYHPNKNLHIQHRPHLQIAHPVLVVSAKESFRANESSMALAHPTTMQSWRIGQDPETSGECHRTVALLTSVRTQAFDDQSHFDNSVVAREDMRKDISKWVVSASGPKSNMTRVYEESQRILEKMDPKSATIAFGKIKDKYNEEIYIGRQFISNSEKDILVVEWQRPAAAPYYKATQSNNLDLIFKREIFSEKNIIFNVNDIFFVKNTQSTLKEIKSIPQTNIDTQNQKSVSPKFDSKKTGEIAEIIQTIDSSQYGLIELPLNHGLIIQGGPGTGKSVVALHRISWLLYNFVSELKSSDILVLGPNKNFITYIENLLPSLGNQNIEYLEVSNLGSEVKHNLTEEVHVSKLKGDKKMSYLLRNALLCKIKNLESDLVINKFYDIDDQRELDDDLVIPADLINEKINNILSNFLFRNKILNCGNETIMIFSKPEGR
jgi:hypothetical protein